MALINCKECGKEISDKAASCPNCGIVIHLKQSKAKTSNKTKIILSILVSVIVLGCIVGFVTYRIHIVNLRIAQEQRDEEERLKAELEAKLEEEAKLEAERIAFVEYETKLVLTCAIMQVYKQKSEVQLYYTNEVWSSAIDDRRDFNKALEIFFDTDIIKDTNAALQKTGDELNTMMIELQNPPYDFTDAYFACLDMYDIYVQLSELAQSPSGSLLTFNSKRNDLLSKFSSAYAKVMVMLPTIEEKIEDLSDDLEI